MRKTLFAWPQGPWRIALLALLFRLAFLAYKISVIPKEVLAAVPFQNEVGNVASALAGGHGFCCLFRQPTGATAWLSPIYPLLIAAIFKVFGVFTFRSFCAAVALNAMTSAAACVPLFYAGERLAGKGTGTLAAYIWAFFPAGIIIPYAWIWDSSLSALLAATILWATVRLVDAGSIRAFVWYGTLWGVALLTNPALSSVLPFLLGWIAIRWRENGQQRTRGVLVCALTILAVCLPWTIRNYRQFHRLIPLRANFAFEFWSGNNQIFDPDSHVVNRITRYEQTRLYARLGETAFLEEKWQEAKAFVRTHPVLYAQLCGRRFLATWFGSEGPWRDFRASDSQLARFLLAWNALCFAAVLVGLWRLYFGKPGYFVPVAAFAVIFPMTFYLAHTTLRHRHPCDPVLALLMAIAVLGAQRGNTRSQEHVVHKEPE